MSGKLPRTSRRLRAMFVFVLLFGLLLAACGTAATPGPTGNLTLTLTAGPVCPVERIPPDPNCAPRPVADAEVIVLTVDGREVSRPRSDAAGKIRLTLPQGRYVIRAVSAAGGLPSAPQEVIVDVGSAPIDVALGYDTGIR